MLPPTVIGVHVPEVTAGVVLVVGLIAVALASVGWRAQRRSRNRNLRFVTGAFALFAVKSAFTAWAVWTGAVEHEMLELVISLMDLAILTLLAWPLLAGRLSRKNAPA